VRPPRAHAIAAAVFGMVLAAAAGVAEAAAGSVLFALGQVEIERNGQVLPAARGTPVEVGDTVTTGPTGLAQLRLRDGGLLSLRSGTSMTVEDFSLPSRAGPVSETAPLQAAAAPAGGRSVLRLLRGAFRTVTGLIGRGADDTYRVATPAATIGIRGTDYSAAWCSGDCGASPDGLYVGVSNGEIFVSNEVGQMVLADSQYAYVRDATTPPDPQLSPPDALEMRFDGESGDGEGDSGEPRGTAPERGETAGTPGAATGSTQPEGRYELLPGEPGMYAFATGKFQGVDHFAGAGINGVYTSRDGALVGFLAPDRQRVVFYSLGTASNLDFGADAATGLRWGRWSGGVASVGGMALDLTSQSLHWIHALAPSPPVLPTSGTASYALIGETRPTDNFGNVGFVGNATLNADFTNQTVTSTLDIGGINNQVWQASGTGSLLSGRPLFAGNYGVTINDALGVPVGTGTGSFTGFFTDGAAGAGLGYSLSDGSTSISGAAAFARRAGGQAGGP
jgi:hypothetical protein